MTALDMVNLYAGPDGAVRVWLMLEYDGEDLDVTEVAEDAIGERPEWLEDELSQAGWESMLCPEWTTEESGEGWVFATTWLKWALENGIAPMQPFLVHIDPPNWYRCGDYGSEWDVEWSSEIVRVLPWKERRVTRHWAKLLRELSEDRANAIEQMRRFRQQRAVDVESMYVHQFVYFAPGQRTYDDMEIPIGIGYSLCSRHMSPKIDGMAKMAWAEMVEGRNDNGDHNAAMKQLIENAVARLPVTEEQIRAMRVMY